MQKHYKKIDKTSGAFFTLGFFLSKLSHLPLHFLSTAFNLLSLLLYFIGYLTWLLASTLHPDSHPRQEKWYGFTQFKKQHSLSAVIGTMATCLAVASLFLHPLLIPCLWLYLISNAIWSIAEYHKYKQPPAFDENYSHTKQKSYFSYTGCATTVSLFVALSTTLNILFPALAFFVVPFFLVLSVGLALAAVAFWADHQFGKHQPTHQHSSYEILRESLKLTAHDNPLEKLEPQRPQSYSHNRGRRFFYDTHETASPKTERHLSADVFGIGSP